MEDKKHKCSSVEHSKIDAVIFCPTCNIFLCNKCQNNFHSKIFANHPIKNLTDEKKDNFIDLCNEHNHLSKFEYFCKTHNKLCCVKCIAKIKDENNGQHKDCDIISLKEIKTEKEKKFKENYVKLEEISKNLENTINHFKILIEQINKDKEYLILGIQKVFTKIRTALNEREDELISKVKEIYKESFFDEEIVKESEKLPLKVKQSLESINEIKEIPNIEKELSSEINYYIEFENNLNKIEEINKTINKCNSNKTRIVFESNYNQLENLIKKFGNINIQFEEKEEKDISIKFERKNIEKIINIENSKFISIENIKIINIGTISFKNLFFVKDIEKSSKDIDFWSNSKNNNIYILQMPSEFEPNNSGTFNVGLTINNPKSNTTYKMVIYVREKNRNKNLSEPFEINVKINGSYYDDEEVYNLYQELEDEYGISGFMDEEGVKAKIKEFNCNFDQIIDWVENIVLNGENN